MRTELTKDVLQAKALCALLAPNASVTVGCNTLHPGWRPAYTDSGSRGYSTPGSDRNEAIDTTLRLPRTKGNLAGTPSVNLAVMEPHVRKAACTMDSSLSSS
jgi:hypothetical protein